MVVSQVAPQRREKNKYFPSGVAMGQNSCSEVLMAGPRLTGVPPSAVLLSKGDEEISVAKSGRPAGREDHVALVGRHERLSGAEFLVGDRRPELRGSGEASVSLARRPIEMQVFAVLPVGGEIETPVRDDDGVQLLRRGTHGSRHECRRRPPSVGPPADPDVAARLP